jgi:hypothetical protein
VKKIRQVRVEKDREGYNGEREGNGEKAQMLKLAEREVAAERGSSQSSM